MSRPCITHHHACDCREHKFFQLDSSARMIRDLLDNGVIAAAFTGQAAFGCSHEEAKDQTIAAFDALEVALEAVRT